MTLMAWIEPADQSGWRTILQRETDAYVLNATNDTGALRPSGGGTLGGTFGGFGGRLGESGECVDACGVDV